MPRFAANLHYLFAEVPFMQRFEQAARAGFRAVEFQVPYDFPAEDLARQLNAERLAMALIDTPVGNWQGGERGIAALPGREAEFKQSLDAAVHYAKRLACDTVHVMAGAVGPDMDRAEMQRVYVGNLKLAAETFRRHGIAAVIEPINNRLDAIKQGPSYTTQGMLGYFLNRTEHAVETLRQVASDNLFLHLDCYHMQLMEGHLAQTFRAHIGAVRHIQIAGVPGRHEPSIGEINYPYLFALFDALNYAGWIGCEYRPKATTWEGLAWGAAYGLGAGARVSTTPVGSDLQTASG